MQLDLLVVIVNIEPQKQQSKQKHERKQEERGKFWVILFSTHEKASSLLLVVS